MIITRLSNFLVLSPKIGILSVVNHSRKKFVERFSYSFHRRATSLINSTGSPFSDSLKSRVHGRNPFSLSIHKGQPVSLASWVPFLRARIPIHPGYVDETPVRTDSRQLAADRWTPPAVEKNDRGKSLGYVQVNDRLEIMQWEKSIFGYEWSDMGLIRSIAD